MIFKDIYEGGKTYSMVYMLFYDSELKKIDMHRRLEFLEVLIDAGARLDNEPDEIKKMKLKKSDYDSAILAKMKNAGWRPPLW